MNVAILLDGDYARRTVRRRLERNPTALEMEQFCHLCLIAGETIFKAYYYDCPPFSENRKLPVSGAAKVFANGQVFALAKQFQTDITKEDFFVFRRGHLSFDGWRIKEKCVEEILMRHRVLVDEDFEPVLTQKQVDMKIGLDIARLSLGKDVQRILLATADADFIPAIHFARANKKEVVLLFDGHASLKIKHELIASCNDHRIIG